jgi:hypothetical protein
MSERIDDGFSTLITLTSGPTGGVKFWEKEVTPPGVEGGGANQTTTMRNLVWRTQAPKKLKTMAEGSAKVSYDPAVYDDIVAMINVNQQIEITFPDDSTLNYWGWLDSFVPDAIVEGQQPTATIKIIPSNQNDAGEETAPVYADAA